ncbi:hypothetical protein [Fusobacterium sp.]|uniref:hypothetical protein n=1 Tax=Fusobacterium sp. TaxID=68766 RepID=UPI002630E0D6|nr:hypothetical protein [Fusobacterium sp.]
MIVFFKYRDYKNSIKITRLNREEFSIERSIENIPLKTETGKYSGGVIIRATHVD